MKFTPNKESDKIDSSLKLSRYLTLSKFLDFLLNKQISFTRLDKFNDIIEGMTYKQLKNLDIVIDMAKADNPALDNLDSIRKAGSVSIKKIDTDTLSIQKGHYVSCWFCDYRESIAMWDLYSNKDGVMLSINAGTLFNCIKQYVANLEDSNYSEFTYGFIDYQKLRPYDHYASHSENKFRAFKKDVCYEHEKEFRFIAVRNPNKKDESLLSINISVKDIFDKFKVTFHPMMKNWQKKNIEKLIETLKYSIALEDSNIRTK